MKREFRIASFNPDPETDLDEELRGHLEERTADLVAQGMSEADARLRAMELMGNLEQFRDQATRYARDREARHRARNRVDGLILDIRYAVRRMRKDPRLTLVAILSLAIGIGATSAVFAIVNGLFFRSPAFRAPNELVQVYTGLPFSSSQPANNNPSYPEFQGLMEASGVFSQVEAFQSRAASVREEGSPRVVNVESITPGIFSLVGLEPVLGRAFLPEEGLSPGANPVVILGYDYWQRASGGDPGVLGSTIHLAGQPYSVVGVAPPELKSFQVEFLSVDLLVPLSMDQAVDGGSGTTARQDVFPAAVAILARLAPGVTLEQARTRVDDLYGRIERAGPEPPEGWSFRLYPLEDRVAAPWVDRGLRLVAAFLFGTGGLVLLLVCANLANLFLARSMDREREMGIRVALGVRRSRLMAQLLTETVLLAVLGGVAGMIVAQWSLGLILSLQPNVGVTLTPDLGPDRSVLLVTFGTAVLAGILFGLAPALASTRLDVCSANKGEKKGRRRGGVTTGSGLVAFQMAVSVVLLSGACLFLRSLLNAQNADLGFSTREAGMLWVDLARSGVPRSEWALTVESLLRGARSQPETRTVGAADALPLLDRNLATFTIPGVDPPEGQAGHALVFYRADEVFFDALGMTLRSGRWIEDSDGPDAQDVVVVTEAAARRFWPDQDPLGREVRSVRTGRSYRVVGVLGDVKTFRLNEQPQPALFLSLAQHNVSNLWMVATGNRRPSAMLAGIRQAVREVNPDLLVMHEQTMEERIGVNLYPGRMAALLLGSLALVALILALTGLYGIASLAVSRRVREIGLRMALGAGAGSVIATLLKQNLISVAVGGMIGLGAAVGLGRLVRSFLFGVSPADPITLAVVPILLGGVAMSAVWLAVRRAAYLNPVETLKAE